MGRRVVLFPCTFQGHIIPMLELAAILHDRGFSVTLFLHNFSNFPDPTNYPDYRFVSIPVTEYPAMDDVVAFVTVLNDCEVPFRDQMTALLSESSDGATPCLIVDPLLYNVQAVAKRLGLPTLLLTTSSAAQFKVLAALPSLWEKGYLPIQDSQLDIVVNEFAPLRVRDLPRFEQSNPQDFRRSADRVAEGARASSGIIFNTFVSIEGDELEKVGEEVSMPIFAIGPLHKLSPRTEGSMMDQDHYGCLEWLDKQASRSVLYVSFGSLVSIGKEVLEEMAWGLANCHRPFLWVVRSGLIQDGSAQVKLPQGFEEETRDRAKIVKWAPQQKVLAHHAVGGFWTHSGWNSTVESISDGIPMLCTPFLADQKGNARFVSEVWKVGFLLENELKREEIEKAIKKLMTEKEGDDMKERARDLKQKTIQCIRKEGSGSSHVALDKLMDYLMSF